MRELTESHDEGSTLHRRNLLRLEISLATRNLPPIRVPINLHKNARVDKERTTKNIRYLLAVVQHHRVEVEAARIFEIMAGIVLHELRSGEVVLVCGVGVLAELEMHCVGRFACVYGFGDGVMVTSEL